MLKKIITFFVILLLFCFSLSLVRGFYRDDLHFAIGAETTCISAETNESYPDLSIYTSAITYLGYFNGIVYFFKHSYLYYNDSLFLPILFCDK